LVFFDFSPSSLEMRTLNTNRLIIRFAPGKKYLQVASSEVQFLDPAGIREAGEKVTGEI
jgi:hypothetical protein